MQIYTREQETQTLILLGFQNLQSGSIFIELVDIAAGSVLIPLSFEIESVLEEIVFDVERMLVTPPHETTVGDDVVDWFL